MGYFARKKIVIYSKIMKFLFTTFIFLTLTSSCRSQDIKEYIVYIFHEDWKRNSLKWNIGDYLWIIPYDGSCKKIDGVQLKPLFVTEEQRFFLDELDNQKLGIGDLPIVLNDKSDSYGYMLFKNRKLIQKYENQYLYSNAKRVLKIYVVPIKAICKDDYLGFYKKNVIRIDGILEIWDGFWKANTINKNLYLNFDFSSFNFLVSYNK
jgi:hypothetical protein